MCFGPLVALTRSVLVPFAACYGQMLLDLAIVLDSSGSVGQDNWMFICIKTISMLSQLQIGFANVRIALVVFSNRAEVIFNFNTHGNIDEVTQTLQKLPYFFGTTNIASALQGLIDEVFIDRNGDRPEANNVVIFITDGESTRERDKIEIYRQQLELKAVKILVIGVTDWANQADLELIASHGWILRFPSFSSVNMGKILDSVLDKVPWCSGK